MPRSTNLDRASTPSEFAARAIARRLTDPARSAAWQALAGLPGLRTCTSPLSWARPHSTTLCINSDYHQTQVGFDTTTGAILTIADLLLQPSPLYPHVVPGTVIEASTFTGRK